MARNDIGGFFVKLGLDTDKNSFETGTKLVDSVAITFNKLIGAARNASVVLAGTAIATGVVESASIKTSTAIGTTTEALDMWKAAAKIAGVSADGLIGSMGKLADVMNHMTIDGSGLEAYSKQLGELGIGFNELMDMDPSEAYAKIIDTAQKKLDGTNMTRITTIVGDILGNEGQEFFIELVRQGKSIEEFLGGAQKTVFTTNADAQKGADFAVEVNTLKTEIQSITKLLGNNVGGIMTPYLQGINQWIQNNGDEIKSTIDTISTTTEKVIGSAVKTVSDWWSTHGDELLDVLKSIYGTTAGVLGKLIGSRASKKAAEYIWDSIEGAVDATKGVVNASKSGGDIAGALIQGFDDAIVAPIKRLFQGEYEPKAPATGWDNDWWKGMEGQPAAEISVINDGIIKPNGQVTQVAPDDWVLAARDLGAIAQAFIPKNALQMQPAAASEYVINQTFNVTGSNDIPQVIRQQAYRGTQEGLLQVMAQSSQRMQMMSGTR